MISANYGRQVGTNLFQSFSQFNLSYPQSATFTGPANVHNILARVTGGSPSSIDGTINSSIQGANLFFLNPDGVMFGQNARINVSGSFAVSTANYLKLADGGKFNTSLGGGDVLTSAPVSAFGFLKAPAGVSMAGTNTIDELTGFIIPGLGLNVAPQKAFSIVAGDIAMNASALTGEGSRVNLVSVKSPGEVELNATDINSAIDVSQFAALGTINLTNLALIDTSGPSRGGVFIRGGNFYLNNSQILSQPLTSIQGGVIDVSISGNMKITNGGFISSSTATDGDGGNIIVTANSLLIEGSIGMNAGNIFVRPTGIFADTGLFDFVTGSTVGSGNGGNITVRAGDLKIVGGGLISSSTIFTGNSGNINVIADSLLIDPRIPGSDLVASGAGIQSDCGVAHLGGGFGGFDASGNAGNIFVRARNLTITGGGVISSSTFALGDAGNVQVRAGTLSMTGGSISSDTQNGEGDAGSVTVEAGELTLVTKDEIFSTISSSDFGRSNGGNVNVTADSILIDASGISAFALHGNAGQVIVTAHDLKITNGGGISSSTFGDGDGGNVIVTADSLLIDGTGSSLIQTGERTGILANSGDIGFGGDFFSGNAGNIEVHARNLKIVNGGEISSSTFTSGKGGDIKVTAESLLIDGTGGSDTPTGIFASAELRSSGRAGSIFVNTTGAATLKHGSSISTSSENGDAGSIDITSGGEIKLKDQSRITVSAGRNGGDITLNAPDLVYLLDSSITATAGNGAGGNITIDPEFIVLNNSLISANAAVGQGGNINLISDFFFNSESLITATGTTNGTVNITAPQLDLGAELITLPTSLLSAERQLQERCTALLRGDFSSFISIGRGGTEPAPEELQSAF